MSDTDRTHALAIGSRLRRVRHQQGMSLADVQHRSDGRWKAVVVGAYERGDRTVTVSRLSELAAFYDVPLADLLPDPSITAELSRGRVTLDLHRLDAAPARTELRVLSRYAAHVARKRGDHNGRVMTLRDGDLDTVALAADLSGAELRERLDEDGILLHPDASGELVHGGRSLDVHLDAAIEVAGETQVVEDDVVVTIDLTDAALDRRHV